MLRLLRVMPSPTLRKRYRAYWSDGTHTDFGLAGGSTFIDHHDVDLRAAYVARHARNGEDWRNPKTAGALSRFLLWGPYPTVKQNLEMFRQRFGV